MKKILLLAMAGMHVVPLLTYAAESDNPSPNWATLRAQYLIHSGHATYAEYPTKDKSALTVAFEGKAAKAVFDQMGPDAKTQCSAEKGDRERRNKGALCTFTAKLENPADAHYRCWIGVDLRTGEGNQGVSC